MWHRNKAACCHVPTSKLNYVQSSNSKLTTCLRKGHLLRFELNSTATSDGRAKKLGNDVWLLAWFWANCNQRLQPNNWPKLVANWFSPLAILRCTEPVSALPWILSVATSQCHGFNSSKHLESSPRPGLGSMWMGVIIAIVEPPSGNLTLMNIVDFYKYT